MMAEERRIGVARWLGVFSFAAVLAAVLLVGCDVKKTSQAPDVRPPAPAPAPAAAPAAPTQPQTPAPPAVPTGLYRCSVCQYVYDPAVGVPDKGTPANTPFADLPADWKCPNCGAGKDKYKPM